MSWDLPWWTIYTELGGIIAGGTSLYYGAMGDWVSAGLALALGLFLLLISIRGNTL
jgi:hypothetical protein